jgi:hypothetical protein
MAMSDINEQSCRICVDTDEKPLDCIARRSVVAPSGNRNMMEGDESLG